MIILRVVILTICSGLLAYAALHDVATRTIPNSVSVALGGLGLILVLVANTVLLSVSIAATILALAVLIWRLGLFGGGDVKLLASTCLLVSPEDVPALLFFIATIGGVLACFYIFARIMLPEPSKHRKPTVFQRIARAELWRIQRRGSLPYAVAIALGTITQLVRQ